MGEPRVASDDGLTLVELLVYSLLLVGVMLIVGTIMISSLNIEQMVRTSTQSASSAQLAASSIESGVRNGTAVAVEHEGDDRVVLVRTAGSDPATVTWHCAAWYFSESAGTIRYSQSASDASPITVPSSEPLDWALLASGVEAVESNEVFSFSGGTLTIEFQGTSDSMQPVLIKSSSVVRAGTWESASCF
ncbi:MAG TPA: hypothetical protein PK781_02015 [Terrimesophilobacter sp.]|nr:hypothetical protein [Terrimesophilobacter sp.]HRP99219.1 hypothetical protein [Terrimesophilobacter sp.]